MASRILLVDDDPLTTNGLARLLERRGYVVREENDPRHALAATREFAPQVVILDYLMPQCHGGDVAWQIATDPTLRSVQLIVCSAIAQAEIAPRLPPIRIPILPKPLEMNALLQLLPA